MKNTNEKALETSTRNLLNTAGLKLAKAEEGGDDIVVIEEIIDGSNLEVCHFLLEGGKSAMKELAYFIISSDEIEKNFSELVLQVDNSLEPENPIGLIFKG